MFKSAVLFRYFHDGVLPADNERIMMLTLPSCNLLVTRSYYIAGLLQAKQLSHKGLTIFSAIIISMHHAAAVLCMLGPVC